MPDPLLQLYPEVAAGGFSRVDGTVAFYTRVNALLRPDMVVLDFGAGRGAFMDVPPSYRRDLQLLRGKVAQVIGVDVDEAVHENPALDKAHVVAAGEPLPLADGAVDVVVADFVFEHVEDAATVGSELARVLKPGGWICARTPNKRGYIAFSARLVPNARHSQVLTRAQPARQQRDIFPTRYALNTPRQVRAVFPEPEFRVFSYTHNGEPAYFGSSVLAWRAAAAVGRLLPQSLGPMRLFFINKQS